MMEIVRRDLDRYFRHSAGDRRARVLAIATNCGLQAVLVYRLGRWLLRLQRTQWWLFPLLIPGWIAYGLALLLTRHGYGIRVALTADIGPGLCIWHFGGIDVRDCSIGSNCAIAQHTTIAPGPDGGAGPVVGDRVLVQPARALRRRVPYRRRRDDRRRRHGQRGRAGERARDRQSRARRDVRLTTTACSTSSPIP